MTPQQAAKQQIEAYRHMTGEESLRIGLQLYETSCELARESIRAKYLGISEAVVEEHLKQRIRIGYQLQAEMELSTGEVRSDGAGRIAVKVINHLGDEVMKVFRVKEVVE